MDILKIEIREAAEYLDITTRSVQRLISLNKLPAEKVPRGQSGWKYQVPLSALPPAAQAKYLKSKSPQSVSTSLDITGKQHLPSWAEREALAKADMVNAWLKVKGQASENGFTIAETQALFLEAYNTGQAYPGIFEVIGGISRGTLYRWERAYTDDNDYTALAPNWGGTRGSMKVTDDEANILLSQLLHQNRIKVETAIRLTKFILERRGLESPSSSQTLRRFIEGFKKRHYDLWTLMREGEKALNDKVLPFIERDSSLLDVGDVLVADGHRLNFQVVNPYTGRPCRAVLVGFYDWASRDLVGYEIMVEENTQAVAGALRNAILELGKIPKAVLLDNGKAFKARVFTSDINFEECGFLGMFARLGISTHFAWPYNPQSKPIERFFGTFTETFERLLPSYTGASVDDKPAYLRRNEKFLKALHNDRVPTIPEAMAMITRWREYYRLQPHRGLNGLTPGEVFAVGRGQGIDVRELDYLMMSIETASIGRNGIRFLGNNYYDEALYGFREKVVFRYSFWDISSIFVYSTSGEYICTANKVEPVHPMASLTDNQTTIDAVKECIRKKRALKRQTLKTVKMAKEACTDVALPWHEIVPAVPKIAEHVEALEADIGMNEFTYADGIVRSVGSGRDGLYKSDYEKYRALKARRSLNPDERKWLGRYESRFAENAR
jgi:putative transposase